MTCELSIFSERLREFIAFSSQESARETAGHPALAAHHDAEFNGMALLLFTLQFKLNAVYRAFCEARRISPDTVSHWTQIPAVPTQAFKEFELSSIAPEERIAVFHSSGTTGHQPSRHFHSAESLELYEASLWPWFQTHLLSDTAQTDTKKACRALQLLSLTPSSRQAPHSSLAHMFDIIRRHLGAPESAFIGTCSADGSWHLNFEAAIERLREAVSRKRAMMLLGTAFAFVNLLDHLSERSLRFELPPGSRLMETGGYKGRSRSLTRSELHALIADRLGIFGSHIVSEYGMSELGSQAYDGAIPAGQDATESGQMGHSTFEPTTSPIEHADEHMRLRRFRFPLWARARVISPETGSEAAESEPGLLQILDLANTYSAMAVQTEDLAMRRADGFELLGRAAPAEPRGCSLMSTGIVS
jgi:hypothetical protein